MKRFFDFSLSLLGLILLLPIFIVVVWVVKKDGGTAFFKQQRVGRSGDIFYILKFRSMVTGAEKMGPLVTASNDPRITSIGRFLRKTKIDEIPQLFNVLMNDISLVGPRPEVLRYVALWPAACKKIILSVKPGITDYATLYYHDEQAVLAATNDPEKAYIEKVMPHKLKMYEQYVKDQNLWLDTRLIIETLLKMANLTQYKRM